MYNSSRKIWGSQLILMNIFITVCINKKCVSRSEIKSWNAKTIRERKGEIKFIKSTFLLSRARSFMQHNIFFLALISSSRQHLILPFFVYFSFSPPIPLHSFSLIVPSNGSFMPPPPSFLVTFEAGFAIV